MREYFFPFATAPSFGQLREQMDRLFGEISRLPLYNLSPRATFPPLNVWEESGALVAEAELPGVRESDLEVVATGSDLTIKGQRHTVNGGEATYHRRERTAGSFSRTLRLPIDVDSSKVEATLRDGVLRLVLPKAEAAQPRTIPISAAK